ncbi:hypothetical protein Tco_1271869, partial [Tanacetum coccineum]
MSGTLPPIPPPLGTGIGSPRSPNANREKYDNLPQLLNSRGGSHVTNVPTFDKDDFTCWKISLPRKWLSMNQTQRANNSIRNDSLAALYSKYHYEEDSDSDVEEDKRTINEFMADLNAEYHERAMLENQKRFYKRIDELTEGKNNKGKGDKGKSEKGLIAESFDWDDKSVSSEDEGTTKFKAFMAIAEDESSVGKGDARSGQWVDIIMKK